MAFGNDDCQLGITFHHDYMPPWISNGWFEVNLIFVITGGITGTFIMSVL